MIITRCHDMDLVKKIVMHPKIYPFVHDDYSPEFNPIDHESLYWMLVSDPDPVGLFMVHGYNSIAFEVHTCLLPEIWGERAKQAAGLLADWFFTCPTHHKLTTHVPEANRAAYRFALRSGMKPEGIDRKSFMKDGVLQDQHVLGMTREDWLCQQQFL